MRRWGGVSFLMGLVLTTLLGKSVPAQVSTDQPGSILVFPKVIADATRDTLIQIVNTGTMAVGLRCVYVNGAGGTCDGNPDGISCQLTSECNIGSVCVRQCTPSNFDVFLTRGQPTVWRASTGRLADPLDPKCRLNQNCSCTTGDGIGSSSISCPGFDPGVAVGPFGVPPLASGFQGELKCVTVATDFETPMGSNKLMGTAVLENLASGQISQYNAMAILATASGPNTDSDLELDDGEYSRCPQNQILMHYTDGVQDPLTAATVTTELTLVPCTELLDSDPTGSGTRARALFQIVDEFESVAGSSDITFDCALTSQLSTINSVFSTGNISSLFAKTRIRTPSGSICLTGTNRGLSCMNDDGCPSATTSTSGTLLGCRAWTGLLGMAEERHVLDGQPTGRGTLKLHAEDGRTTDDLIDLGLGAP